MAHKQKKPNTDPIIQISPIEYFSRDPEPMPDWLKKHTTGSLVRIRDIGDSRVVYYPGAGTDGSPIHIFNSSHAAHIYVYVDYGFSKATLDLELSNSAFMGYQLHHQQAVSQKELLPYAPTYHITNEEMGIITSGNDMGIRPEDAFAVLKIYQRKENFGEAHGAYRFAILYIGADANATFDALFCNTVRAPYACIVCNNMGSGYSCFTRHSLMEKIAMRVNRYPQYLLCERDYGWDRYEMLRTVSGTQGRFVWTKQKYIL